MVQREMTSVIGKILCWCKVKGERLKGKDNLTPYTLHLTPKWGFTLVEMLVVLAIIAMLLGISIPFTARFGKGLRIKTSARAILGTLRVARSSAITHRSAHTVLFDAETGEYWIEDSEGHIFERKRKLPSSVRFEILGEEESDPITFEDDKVIFYSTGAIEGVSGSITITNRQGDSKTISVIGSTGKIMIK